MDGEVSARQEQDTSASERREREKAEVETEVPTVERNSNLHIR